MCEEGYNIMYYCKKCGQIINTHLFDYNVELLDGLFVLSKEIKCWLCGDVNIIEVKRVEYG